jgi:hypothetical protein
VRWPEPWSNIKVSGHICLIRHDEVPSSTGMDKRYAPADTAAVVGHTTVQTAS